jgi:hypothetical protein
MLDERDDYYMRQRHTGEGFERYVVAQLRLRGVTIARHEGKRAQLAFGDTTLGIEIKYDLLLERTGNLYIEVAEKKHADNPRWIASGIEASSSARWYGIGNTIEWYLISREALRRVKGRYREIMIDRGTSRGFLLPRADAERMAARVLIWAEMNL